MLSTLFVYEHSLTLVIVAFLIAVLASYTVLDLANRVSVSSGVRRIRWLLCGAMVMGTGIWSMHFTAMLAFRPPVQTFYNIPIVIASWVIAMIPSGLALHTSSRERVTWPLMTFSGILMGLGIAAMHYVGMEAIEFHAQLSYDLPTFILSIAVAIVASIAALWLSVTFRNSSNNRLDWAKLGSAVVMGMAISGMHHVGMNAAIIQPLSGAPPASYPFAADISLIGTIAIIGVTVIVLAFTLVFSIIDQRMWIQEQNLAFSKSELVKSNARMARHVKDLKIVQEVARLSMSSLDHHVLIQSIAQKIYEAFAYKAVFYFEIEPG
ncbi:MAG: MHYT domain-containing protein, partial [Chloroflexota bacterium]